MRWSPRERASGQKWALQRQQQQQPARSQQRRHRRARPPVSAGVDREARREPELTCLRRENLSSSVIEGGDAEQESLLFRTGTNASDEPALSAGAAGAAAASAARPPPPVAALAAPEAEAEAGPAETGTSVARLRPVEDPSTPCGAAQHRKPVPGAPSSATHSREGVRENSGRVCIRATGILPTENDRAQCGKTHCAEAAYEGSAEGVRTMSAAGLDDPSTGAANAGASAGASPAGKRIELPNKARKIQPPSGEQKAAGE